MAADNPHLFEWPEAFENNHRWLIHMCKLYPMMDIRLRNISEIHLRVRFVYDLFKKYNKLPGLSPTKTKSNEKSENFRQAGNELYKKDDLLLGALKEYTKSIAHAENKTSTLALAYGNRSAVLFRMKYYAQCLEDIELALDNNYPKHLRAKLKNRKTEAIKFMEKQVTLKFHDNLPSIVSQSSVIKCAAESVEILQNEEFGRHIVATRDIKLGEVIAVEKPYASQIRSISDNFMYCHECLGLCYNPIPCTRCTKALYCTERCKDEALQSYHKYECPLLVHDVDTYFIFIKVTLKCLDEYENLEKDNDMKGEYCSDRYKEIFHLHTDLRRPTLMDIVGITHFFHYFKNCTNLLKKIDEATFCNLLSHNMKIDANSYSCNVAVRDAEESDGHESLSGHIGTGIFSFHGLYNHSCNPNITRNSYGCYMVTRAISNIKKGQQCFVTYYSKFHDCTREKRRAYIQDGYNFVCKCEACFNNWPMFHNLPKKDNTFMTRYNPVLVSQIISRYKTDTSVLNKSISVFADFIENFENHAPCMELAVIIANIEVCYKFLANNIFNLPY